MNKYDFELLVTPEEFKRNKERVRSCEQKENEKEFMKGAIFGALTILGMISLIVIPAIIEMI
jgi:hypothetical protein